jgi:2-aminoethylphosphonate-pyruvate transaminase
MNGKRMLLDSISGIGGETLQWNDRIRVCAGTANKCLQGLPGISFVLMHKEELKRIENFPSRSLYFDLKNYWKEQTLGGVPFTPSVQTFYALDEALKELLREGVSNRICRYKRYSDQLRDGFKALGLEYFINERYHSNTLTALKLPPGLSYEVLHDDLKSNGFVIYAGQGALKNIIFRVANMGNLKMQDINRFLKCLKIILSKNHRKRWKK